MVNFFIIFFQAIIIALLFLNFLQLLFNWIETKRLYNKSNELIKNGDELMRKMEEYEKRDMNEPSKV